MAKKARKNIAAGPKKLTRGQLAFSIPLRDARGAILAAKVIADEAVMTGEQRVRELKGATDQKGLLKQSHVENALLRAVKAQQALDAAHTLLFNSCCNQFHNCDPDFR